MAPKLTDEMRQALQSDPDHFLKIEDDQTERVYVLVDEELADRAMRALQRQDDLNAVADGLKQMESGRVIPLDQADQQIREQLGFPKNS